MVFISIISLLELVRDLLARSRPDRHTLSAPSSSDPTGFSKHILVGAWCLSGLTGGVIVALGSRLNANKRHLHQLMLSVQAISFLGYSLAAGGYGYIPKSIEDRILIGKRDEYLLHYLLPILNLPAIIYVTNHISGIFLSEGLFIIASLTIGALYGLAGIFLPRNIIGCVVLGLSVIFALPYLNALVNTWPSSVRAAPQRVRMILKTACAMQVLTLLGQLITFDLALNQAISADLENLLLTACDVMMYNCVPLVLLSNNKALRDVFSREEYIRQTVRTSPMNLPQVTNQGHRDAKDTMLMPVPQIV